MKVVNKKARFDYEVVDEWEAGVVLTGAEVKSAKKGAVSLSGARVMVKNNEMLVVGMQINAYEFASNEAHEPLRSRKLLLNRQEIEQIRGRMEQKGLTVVPLTMYNKGGRLKLKIGLVRGKKRYEKREEERKQAAARQIQIALKKRRQN